MYSDTNTSDLYYMLEVACSSIIAKVTVSSAVINDDVAINKPGEGSGIGNKVSCLFKQR